MLLELLLGVAHQDGVAGGQNAAVLTGKNIFLQAQISTEKNNKKKIRLTAYSTSPYMKCVESTLSRLRANNSWSASFSSCFLCIVSQIKMFCFSKKVTIP